MDKHFITHDLNLTATIVALGHTLENIQKNADGRAAFCFKRTEQLKQDVTAYWQQGITIQGHKLFDSLKYVKSRLYHAG